MTVAWMVAVCIGIGVAIRLLRRLPRLVFAATLVGLILLLVLLLTAASAPSLFFGRTLTLDLPTRAFLLVSIGMTAALALFGPLTFERASDVPSIVIANSQGSFFFWSLASLILAITLDSFSLSVFFWAIGLVILMLASHPQREGRVGGAAQFLLLIVIAGACLLIGNRMIDLYPLTPENLDLIRNTVIFLALGFGLLLAAAPLTIWLGPLAEEMPTLGMAFLTAVAQPVGIWLLWQQMNAVSWLIDRSPWPSLLLTAGAITVPVGALLLIAERRAGRLIAYAALIPLGYGLIGLGLGTRLGLSGAVLEILNRALSIALIAGGMSFVRHHLERRWQVVGALAIFGGALTMAGVPPTLGFASHYAILKSLVATNPEIVVVLLVSSAMASLALLRVAWNFLSAGKPASSSAGELKIVPYLCAIIVVILFVLNLLAGVFPQTIIDPLLAALGQAAALK